MKKNKSKPIVSILMPVYNGGKFLKEAIESILDQSYKNFEYIIVDDGSTDSTTRIITALKNSDNRIVHIRNNKNHGTSVALNLGIKASKGKYIVRMDADDWSYPDRIKNQLDYMEANPEIVVSGGTIEVCDNKLKVLNTRSYQYTDKEIREKIFIYSPFAHPATIWKASVLKEIGGYNPAIPYAQDYELYFRIGVKGKFGNLDRILVKLRTHNNSSSMKYGKIQEHFTLYARIKGYLEYKYKMTFFDKTYSLIQLLSMILIPGKVKFKLFNYLRRYL